MLLLGISLAFGHELAPVFAGGFSPLIATYLLAQSASSTPIAVFVIVLAVITVVTLLAAGRTVAADRTPAPAEADRVSPTRRSDPNP